MIIWKDIGHGRKSVEPGEKPSGKVRTMFFDNPQIVESAQTAQSLDPLVVMIVGMAVVFLGLIILIGVVKLVSLIYRACIGKNDVDIPASALNQPVYSPTKAAAQLAPSQLTDEQRRETVVAVSAAIAEAMGKPVSGIRIHSIKKIG